MPTARAAAVRSGRLTARATGGSYRAAHNPRSRVRVGTGGSGDWHADWWERQGLRELSQDLTRNANDYDALLERLAALIGCPRIRTPDTDTGRRAAELWQRDAADPAAIDVRAQSTFPALCHHWWYLWARDGDVFPMKLGSGHLLTLESAQITGDRKPGDNQYRFTRGGVTYDQLGRWINVWVAPFASWGGIDILRSEPYPATSVIPLVYRHGPSQTRGVPLLTAALDDVERVDSLRESEIISSEQASMLYGAIERQAQQGQAIAPGLPLGSGSPIEGGSALDATDDGRVDEVDWVAGTYLDLPAGQQWKAIAHQRPNLDVVALLQELVRSLCAKVGVAYELLFSDLRGLSWSTARALISQSKGALHHLRSVYFEPFVRELYAWRVRRWIRAGELTVATGEDPLAVEWAWPDPEWPDPSKEAQAHEMAFGIGTTSRARVVGPEWRDIAQELHEEAVLADRLYLERYAAAERLIAERGLAITPQEVLLRDRAVPPGFQPIPLRQPTPDAPESTQPAPRQRMGAPQ